VSDLPFIVMTGGLVDDPELRFTPSGKAVVNFRLAGKKRVRDAQGQWTDGDPIYLSVTAWEKVAENVAETLVRKGQRVTVTGRLEQQWWEGKDGGAKQSKYVIIADSVSVDLTFSTYTENERTQGGGTSAKAPVDDPWAAPPQAEEPPF
jgi:single-strand DNA-binding protein